MAVAFIIASVSAALHFFRAIENGGRSDFAPIWHAARLMLAGENPYALIGPGNAVESAWPIFYPATTFVAAVPFTIIPSFHWASTTFVFVSAALLAWGATHDGWHRLPIFPSIAFLTSATLAQWSVIMTAAVFIPALGLIAAAKPQSAMPVIGSTTSARMYAFAVAGAVVLVAASMLLLPTWPADWWRLLRTTENFVPPLVRWGGPLILVGLLRWRRPEAWLILIAACMPQTWPPYNGLMLMAVARTYREAAFLSLFSSVGWIVFAWFAEGLTLEEERVIMSAVLNFVSYLPAVAVVLARPNAGDGPLWLEWIARRVSRRSRHSG